MDIYLTPVLFLAGAWVTQIRRNRWIDQAVLVTMSILIMAIVGLRWYADADYWQYVEMWDDNPTLANFTWDAIASLYGEPGYLILTAVFKSAGTGFAGLALACAVLSVSVKSFVLSRLSRHASFALCLYLCIHFLTIEFIQMRWAVATAFIALGFFFQYEKKYFGVVLCFGVALAFHYFSVLFWAVAIAVPFVRRHRTIYILSGLALAASLFVSNDQVAPLLMNQSDLYVLARIARYASDPAAPLGIFSFAKLAMYVVIYGGCTMVRRSYDWEKDPLNMFLFRVAFLSIGFTLALSFQPILHYRAGVMADLFAIILIVNSLSIALTPRVRSMAFAGLAALYGAWYLLDLRNNIAVYYINEYRSWLSS